MVVTKDSITRDLQKVKGELKPRGKRNGRHYTVYEKIDLLNQAWDHELYPAFKEARQRGDLEGAKELIKDVEPRHLQEFFSHCYAYDHTIFDKLRSYAERGNRENGG